jgi:ABC-type transport system involved in cytochrome c biogenesis permease component
MAAAEWVVSMAVFSAVVSFLLRGALADPSPSAALFWALSTMLVIMQQDRSSARSQEQGTGRLRQIYAGFAPCWFAEITVNWLVLVPACLPPFLILVLPRCLHGSMAWRAGFTALTGLAVLNAAAAFPAAVSSSLRSRSGMLAVLALPALLVPLPVLEHALSAAADGSVSGYGWFFFCCGYGLLMITLSAMLVSRIGAE